MESIFTELALYGSKNEFARTDHVFPPISVVCDGTFSIKYIIINDGILRFNSFNITFKPWIYFTVHSLGSIQTYFQ